MPTDRRWSDADRELVAMVLLERTRPRFGHETTAETVAAVLDALTADGRLRENAAADIERYAESIGWYEGGGVWAEAIELAKGEHVTQDPAFAQGETDA